MCILKFMVKSPANQQFFLCCDSSVSHYLPRVSKSLQGKTCGSRNEVLRDRQETAGGSPAPKKLFQANVTHQP